MVDVVVVVVVVVVDVVVVVVDGVDVEVAVVEVAVLDGAVVEVDGAVVDGAVARDGAVVVVVEVVESADGCVAAGATVVAGTASVGAHDGGTGPSYPHAADTTQTTATNVVVFRRLRREITRSMHDMYPTSVPTTLL